MTVEQAGPERPQDYGDLVRLLATVRALEVREPARQGYHEQLLVKLTRAAEEPGMIRGGRDARGERWIDGAA